MSKFMMKTNQSERTIGWFALFLAVAILWAASLCGAAAESATEPPAKKKAVLETSKRDGFRLSEKAERTIALVSKPIESAPVLTIPESALVHSLDRLAIYRLREGWYKLVPVDVVRKNGSGLTVRSDEVRPGTDRVVTGGIELLRATEMEAFGGEE